MNGNPHANVGASPGRTATSDTIAWPSVRVTPGAAEAYPAEPGASHYYAARHTAASPLRAGTQSEKFLFYRGLGRAPLPVRFTSAAGGALAVSAGKQRNIEGWVEKKRRK